MTKLEFMKGMKRLVSLYRTDMTENDLNEWYERLKEYDADALYKAIDNIKSKHMPNALELQELIETECINNNFKILDLMWDDGYFKYGAYGELAPEQQSRNFEKTMMWLNTGVIPEWFKADMGKYLDKLKLGSSDIKKIGANNGRSNLQLPN